MRLSAHTPGARDGLKWMSQAINDNEFTYLLKLSVTALEFSNDSRGMTLRFVCNSPQAAQELKAWTFKPQVLARLKTGYQEAGITLYNITTSHE